MTVQKIMLVDEHRAGWLKLVNKTIVFRGTVVRFGHKHRQGERIKRGATLLLTDVHRKGSKFVINHAWVDYTPALAKLGEQIGPNAELEFSATVSTYTKGGKHSYQNQVSGTFEDLQLINLKPLKIIRRPNFSRKYPKLVD